jgi:hypothetical protein
MLAASDAGEVCDRFELYIVLGFDADPDYTVRPEPVETVRALEGMRGGVGLRRSCERSLCSAELSVTAVCKKTQMKYNPVELPNFAPIFLFVQ